MSKEQIPTAEEFYEIQRKHGRTYFITSNPDPDYSNSFYQEIFDLMENYSRINSKRHLEAQAEYIKEKAMNICSCGGYPDCICNLPETNGFSEMVSEASRNYIEKNLK